MMRVILRNRRTGLYYASWNRWVPDPSRALDFDKIKHAGRLAFKEGAAELEVVLIDEDSNCVLALPIRMTLAVEREEYGGQTTLAAA